MNNRLGDSLTVAMVVLTAGTAAWVTTGPGLAIAVAVVSGLALVAWLRLPLQENTFPRVIVPYLGIIVVNLLLATARYWSGFDLHLQSTLPGLFAARYGTTDVTWLLGGVITPVTLMLLGGFLYARNYSLGRYIVWWTFIFAVIDALVQFGVEFATPGYDHRYFLGALAALVQLGLGLVGWVRLMDLRSGPAPDPVPVANARTTNLWTMLFIAFGAVYGFTLLAEAGPLPVGVIVGSMVGGVVAWRRTTAHAPADRMKILPLYLLMLSLFYLHVGEETLTGFNHAIATITGKPWDDHAFTILIVLIGPAIWVAGAISLWLRQAFGNFILWFMIIGMILGEPTHLLVFPIVAMVKFGIGYSYFSGMFTALFPMIPAIIAAVALVADSRKRVGLSAPA